ncbi:TPA: hypothetical protein NH808_002420 [Pseudomonas aeruginosa]|uniref:hypothetical protein n=1 Tax=Pseudomonas aeruginosa TaxID=287 RepID=UPI0004736FB4|nr:hypothetical protein [Pseudomonas aeruginosa]EKV6516188.1 hypothetical protein [Pseudomonas aeruginosa]KSG40538.1 hypothetical protein AO946_04080 [Pseudomonas aeruginosa]KSI04604.1 hypothetical protein AO984_26390 [Pseudomonas aeruginosa]KSM15766.1 hypothetical protein APA61_19810 [Pseudomonas aeruginosa]MBG4155449.1 hypothetical protein [Pseudomonas aeruginosa]
MSTEKYRSEQVQRTLRVMLALAANEFRGLLLKEVAVAAECDASAALRALENLRTAGLADRSPHDHHRWLLGPRLVQVAFAFDEALRKAQHELDERRQRYTRTPN